MKVLFYILALLTIYFGVCALNDIIHFRPFSALFELLLAGAAAYGAYKINNK